MTFLKNFLLFLFITSLIFSKDLLPAYNASSQIKVKNSWQTEISAGYLFWQVKEDGLEIALKKNGKTHFIDMNFDYKSGFKVGALSKFNYDNWNIFVQYFRMHLKNSKRKKAENGFFTPLKTYFSQAETETTNNNTSSCYGKWQLDYDVVHVEVARPCYVGNALTFKPHVGILGGWIKQKERDSYTFTDLVIPKQNLLVGSNAKTSSWMVGPRTGLYTNWLFNSGIKIFLNAAISISYQHFDTFFKQENYLNINTLDKNAKDKIGYLNPIFDIATGLGWQKYLDNKNWCLSFLIGYDFTLLFCQNRMRVLIDEVLRNMETTASNLYLHGLSVSGKIDF